MTWAELIMLLAASREPVAFATVPMVDLPRVVPPPERSLAPVPLPGPDFNLSFPVHGTVTSRFGMRRWHFHQGIDIAAPNGSPVWATADGRVSNVGWHQGYGLMVTVDHGHGRETRYAHLSAASVHAGEWVTAGETIGAVGSTGHSTGPHVHYETRRDGVAVNPGLA